MSLVEWLGVATGVLCVWLTVRQHIANWPIGIANNVLMLVLFVPHRLYADAGLQVVYVVLGAYGWWHWWRGDANRHDALPVRRTPRREALVVAVVSLVAFAAVSRALVVWTDSDVPYWDALPTTLSLAAQYLITRKYLANWAVWILGVNLPFLVLYEYKGLHLVAALQLVFVVLSALGWREWRRSLGAAVADDEVMAWSAA